MKIKKIKSNTERNCFNLDVAYEEGTRKLIVFLGTFRIASMDYELEEDEEYIIPICSDHTFIYGHLIEQDDGTVRVIFDATSHAKPPVDLEALGYKDFGIFIQIETMGNDTPMITVTHLVDTSEEESAEAAIIEFYRKVGLLGSVNEEEVSEAV